MAHPVFDHGDETTCAQDENGHWWTPYDAGGEGPECTRDHTTHVVQVMVCGYDGELALHCIQCQETVELWQSWVNVDVIAKAASEFAHKEEL
jgi:hypothetical protein